jgi:hypothetical protein
VGEYETQISGGVSLDARFGVVMATKKQFSRIAQETTILFDEAARLEAGRLAEKRWLRCRFNGRA